jgi:hypothetical protein
MCMLRCQWVQVLKLLIQSHASLKIRVYAVIGENNEIVESVITNVAVGANEAKDDRTPYSHKAKVGIAFVEFGQRHGKNTADYLDQIREATKVFLGVEDCSRPRTKWPTNC